MTEQHFKSDTGKGILTSVDFRSADDYAAITNTGEIITPYRRLDTTENLLYPIIRMLPDGHFLTAGARCKGNNNAVIYDPDGKVIRSFLPATASKTSGSCRTNCIHVFRPGRLR